MTEFNSIMSGFERSCKQFPENIAVHCLDESVSYETLEQTVLQWSNAFLNEDLKGKRILIHLDKGIEYVKSIYACLAAGAIYVPVDASQPIERILSIISQAQPDLIITDESKCKMLNDVLVSRFVLSQESCYFLNKDQKQVFLDERLDKKAIFHKAKPDEVAAILFTSGSTGVPKGVQISHKNLAYFINWAVDSLNLTQKDVLSNHASFSFDLSTFDLFAASQVGAATWVITTQQQKFVAELVNGIKKYNVSIWYSVPSVLSMMVATNALDKNTTSRLRHVIFAGEVYPIGALRTLNTCLADTCSLHNWYGPTETNVCLYHKITNEDLTKDHPVPIGKPLAGSDAVIDCDTGELIIYGPSVTPGYSNVIDGRNAKLHEQFGHATGDLVRFENGVYYYQDRIDDMVKINGHRIELGEINACLSTMPEIYEVVVQCITTDFQQKLIAYIVPNTEAKINTLAVKQFASEKLPRYMVPNNVKCLSQLPRNANGKVDYKILRSLA
ncbi:AMP-binding protein [Pseudoalteromonas denitrificans]|uniref:L-prolyl-[peptidyl carrier protein] synthetase n=1 Tax=Pseudoalteromonas denitrificans DSM 6059 TaxID=1123010 RepID=A0A1I1G8H4_9GAMM|nr:AMP-binding protein [Pseudoalteromonas denitrificans]SFC05460.1 L-prolyl-[peptidyl carrier protein] synthetase [Pseudoalteromonas denitrificans DSM 6059]